MPSYDDLVEYHRRKDAAWAWAHEEAERLHGPELAPACFCNARGNLLMAELELQDIDADDETFRAVAARHIAERPT